MTTPSSPSFSQRAVDVRDIFRPHGKQDFERDRLVLHEISVRSDSGRALGFELNVEQLQTLVTVECFGRIRNGLRCFLKHGRVAWWELEGLVRCDFSGPPQIGDPVALPLCLPIRSQVLSSTGTSLHQCTCRARGFCRSHDFDGVRLGQVVASRRCRQRCLSLRLRSSTKFLESLRCRYGGSNS